MQRAPLERCFVAAGQQQTDPGEATDLQQGLFAPSVSWPKVAELELELAVTSG